VSPFAVGLLIAALSLVACALLLLWVKDRI
jgi:hypothetical protein